MVLAEMPVDLVVQNILMHVNDFQTVYSSALTTVVTPFCPRLLAILQFVSHLDFSLPLSRIHT